MTDFKWPYRLPSHRADPHELADYAEILAWQNKFVSLTALSNQVGRLSDNDYSSGVPEEEEADEYIRSAFEEIEVRLEVCGEGYPFAIDQQGYRLRTKDSASDSRHVIYKYLLLATRLNMKNNRSHSNIDGTHLLEELAKAVGREYFGARAKGYVFGTANSERGFPGKVHELCKLLNEGGE